MFVFNAFVYLSGTTRQLSGEMQDLSSVQCHADDEISGIRLVGVTLPDRPNALSCPE